MLIVFDKPYGVLSQFTSDGSANTPLGAFDLPKDVYAIGRLDADSEGMLLLSDEKGLTSTLLDPKRAHPRTYFAQVENVPSAAAIEELAAGVRIKSGLTLPAKVGLLDVAPPFGPRTPPIRERKHIPTAWLSLTLTEGKNRQVRKMTAAVGHPTLRLVRVAIGDLSLLSLRERGLAPGCAIELDDEDRQRLFARSPSTRPGRKRRSLHRKGTPS